MEGEIKVVAERVEAEETTTEEKVARTKQEIKRKIEDAVRNLILLLKEKHIVPREQLEQAAYPLRVRIEERTKGVYYDRNSSVLIERGDITITVLDPSYEHELVWIYINGIAFRVSGIMALMGVELKAVSVKDEIAEIFDIEREQFE